VGFVRERVSFREGKVEFVREKSGFYIALAAIETTDSVTMCPVMQALPTGAPD